MTQQTPVPVTYANAAPQGAFFVLEPSFHGDGKGHGLELANKDRLKRPGTYVVRPPNGSPDQYPERPQLVLVPDLGSAPRDLEELAGIWIVSERAKQVFASVDPEGFAFVACDYALADGSPGDQRYFCNVVRTLDALDEQASTLKIETGEFVNGKYYDRSGGARLVFRTDAVGAAHVFRTPYAPTVFCDRALRDAVTEAGLSGVGLTDAADC